MNFLSQNETEIPFPYDENLKTAFKKTKIIEKRVQDRTQMIRRKFTEFKNVCRIIRFQQLLKQPQYPQQPHLSSLTSKDLMKENSSSMGQQQKQEDRESAKEEDVKISKTQAKLSRIQQTKIEGSFQETKIEFQSLNHSSSQEGQEYFLMANQIISEVRKQYEPERNESSGQQRSDYQTPKFIESQKESSFGLKSPIPGEDPSFLTENQDYERAKFTNTMQRTFHQETNPVQYHVQANQKFSHIIQPSQPQIPSSLFQPAQIHFQPQLLVNYNIFSFSNLPPNQQKNTHSIPNLQTVQTKNYQSSRFCKESEKENIRNENVSIKNVKQEANSPPSPPSPRSPRQFPSPEKVQKVINDNNMLRSIDRSAVESFDGKSQSFHQIYDHFEKFFKVNEPLDTPIKKPIYELSNEQNEAPKKELPQQDLSSLTVNSQFPLIVANSQKVAKNKNRLFKEKRKKKNSSDKSSSD